MNKTVLITGASSGFGQACAIKFASEGYDLIITARRNDRLMALKKEIEENSKSQVYTACFDIRDHSAVEAFVEELPDSMKSSLSILINNAGLAVGRSPIHEGIIDDWERMIDTNIKGLLYMTRYIAPILKDNGGGHIINIASIAGKEVYPNGNVYCASKHAVDALSKAMRIDLLNFGIKVTNIAPGAAETEFSIVRFKGDKELADSIYQGYTPLYAEDIAEVVYFAASRPAHVNLNDIVIMPSSQATSTITLKK